MGEGGGWEEKGRGKREKKDKEEGGRKSKRERDKGKRECERGGCDWGRGSLGGKRERRMTKRREGGKKKGEKLG